MREIKFRAKDYAGQWVYGDLLLTSRRPRIQCDPYTLHQINPETIGQFTGVYDKNGREIWEDDIIEIVGLKYNGVITFKRGAFEVIRSNYPYLLYHVAEIYKGMIEVIGNIYDDSELVKE